MILQKRDCPLEIELIPHGGGWTYIYLTSAGERIFFVVSNVLGNQFSDLVRVLYFFSPLQNDPDNADIIENKVAAFDIKSKTIGEIYDDGSEPVPGVYIDIPYRAEFTWDEEGGFSRWVLERQLNTNPDFTVKLHIEIHRGEREEEYDFEFLYKDLCYAVAKAYTKALKEYGFYGYHVSTYHEEVSVHQLLFLKAVALDCLKVREWATHPSGNGETTRIQDEIELLLFGM